MPSSKYVVNNINYGDIHNELNTHKLSFVVEFFYKISKANKRRILAKIYFNVLGKLEGGQYRSATMRKLLARDYHCVVGVHSYGELFMPGAFSPSVNVGKYTSIGRDVRVFTQNHPIDTLSTHPYFYEKQFGVVLDDMLKPATTVIGHDVWIGQSAVILPGCKEIGHGAIIGAGAVVTKNVPAYAIVAGNPAKILKFRFDAEKITKLLSCAWWDKSIIDLKDQHSVLVDCND